MPVNNARGLRQILSEPTSEIIRKPQFRDASIKSVADSGKITLIEDNDDEGIELEDVADGQPWVKPFSIIPKTTRTARLTGPCYFGRFSPIQ
jgi:hypothetical protein